VEVPIKKCISAGFTVTPLHMLPNRHFVDSEGMARMGMQHGNRQPRSHPDQYTDQSPMDCATNDLDEEVRHGPKHPRGGQMDKTSTLRQFYSRRGADDSPTMSFPEVSPSMPA